MENLLFLGVPVLKHIRVVLHKSLGIFRCIGTPSCYSNNFTKGSNQAFYMTSCLLSRGVSSSRGKNSLLKEPFKS